MLLKKIIQNIFRGSKGGYMSYSSYTKLEDEKTSRLLFFGLQSQETCSMFQRFQKK